MDVQEKIADFVSREFLYNDRSRLPGPDEPLLGSEGGPVDSVGLHQLIVFSEEQFHIAFEDSDIVPENFANLRALAAFVEGKMQRPG